jgi:hypothetical protein
MHHVGAGRASVNGDRSSLHDALLTVIIVCNSSNYITFSAVIWFYTVLFKLPGYRFSGIKDFLEP